VLGRRAHLRRPGLCGCAAVSSARGSRGRRFRSRRAGRRRGGGRGRPRPGCHLRRRQQLPSHHGQNVRRRPRQSLRSTPHQATAATGTHERVRLQRMLNSSRGTAVRLCTGAARAAQHGAAEPAGPQGAPSAGTPAGTCRACAGCMGSPAAACATSCCKTCSCATAACRTACTQHSRHALSHARPQPRCLRDTTTGATAPSLHRQSTPIQVPACRTC